MRGSVIVALAALLTIAAAAAWGDEHRLVEAARIPGGWRVVLSAVDQIGSRWPLVVRVDDAGSPLEDW